MPGIARCVFNQMRIDIKNCGRHVYYPLSHANKIQRSVRLKIKYKPFFKRDKISAAESFVYFVFICSFQCCCCFRFVHSILILQPTKSYHIHERCIFSSIQYWLDKVLSTLFDKILIQTTMKCLCGKSGAKKGACYSFFFVWTKKSMWNSRSVHRFRSLTAVFSAVFFCSYFIYSI